MLECGVQFGHQVENWNPKMAPYILGASNGMHIIDIRDTQFFLKQICQFLEKNVRKDTSILFIGTKVQIAPVIKSVAEKSDSFYVNQRWLGGMLTNWNTIKTCIQKLKQLDSIFLEETQTKER